VNICGFRYPIVGGFVEIDGHKLNPEQVELFAIKARERLEIASRPGSSIQDQFGYACQLGLSDLLWVHRPTAKARDRLLNLGDKLSKIAMQMQNLREFSFYQDSFAAGEGSVLLLRLVQEAERRLFKIKHFAASMATEHSTKLQDWTKREAEFKQLEEVQP
jgi:hypothetical protein